MNNNLIVIAYAVYLPVVILLTLYVAHTLFKNSKVFMLQIFRGNAEIALSTNKLFEVGFYLLNVGFALMIMQIYAKLTSKQEIFEVLSVKIGGYSIYLGVMLFLNLFLFFRGKKAAKANQSSMG
ncbi:MAG: hypothetical protein K1X55_11245 [Chitinophagales bacterium]|nr:hypothetical protein [Chitinophagales bacterium]